MSARNDRDETPDAFQTALATVRREAGLVSLSEQIAELERELRSRRRAYPRIIADGKARAEDAARAYHAMDRALATLKTIAPHAEAMRRIIISARERQARTR